MFAKSKLKTSIIYSNLWSYGQQFVNIFKDVGEFFSLATAKITPISAAIILNNTKIHITYFV